MNETYPTYKIGPEFLTIIIRNDGPLVNAGDRPSYRTIQIELTAKQRDSIKLHHTHTSGTTDYYEQISQAILEDL